jgi:hypothetical protein
MSDETGKKFYQRKFFLRSFLIGSLLFLMCLFFSLVAKADDQNIDLTASVGFNCLITASSGDNGSITPDGTITIYCGSNQTFNITSNNNFHIADVLVDNVSVGAVSSFTFHNATTSHTIYASFAPDTNSITASAGANGSISPNGSIPVDYGSDQTFSITSDDNYHVADVLVDGSSVGAVSSYTFANVTTTHTISATFAVNPNYKHTITATINGHGTISPSGSILVDHGTDQSFTITPDDNYHLDDLLIDGASVGSLTTYTFHNITTDHTIMAVIGITTYHITASAGSNGLISPSGIIMVDASSNKTFKISSYIGYYVDSVNIDGVNYGNLATYTFNSISNNHTIEANFAAFPTSIDNPTNFVGTASDNDVTLSWTNPPTIWFSYVNIYRSTIPGVIGDRIATNQTGINYHDLDLNYGTTYYYTLKAADNLGNISTGTNQLAITLSNITDIEAPTAPTNFRSTATDPTGAALAWDASTDNIGVAGYKLFNADTNLMIATTQNISYTLANLTPNTQYNFYLQAYDVAGNTSVNSAILSVNTTQNSQVSVQAHLVMYHLPNEVNAGQMFNNKVEVMAVDAGGVPIQTYVGSVYFTSSDKKAKLAWNKNHSYRFTNADMGVHMFDGSDFELNTMGSQKLTVTDGSTEQNGQILVLQGGVTGALQSAQKTISMTLEANPNIEKLVPATTKIGSTVVVTTASLLAAPVVADVALGTINIWPQILYLMSHLFQFLGLRRRRKPWGTVFNSQNGQPIPYALVKIFDQEYNRLLETATTDNEGRFGFLVRTGHYFVTVQKAGYSFPSQLKISNYFDSVYTGQVLQTDAKNQTVILNIPLDPLSSTDANYKLLVWTIKAKRVLANLRITLLIAGILFAFVSIILSFSFLYVLSLAFYVLVIILELVRLRKARSYGVVSDTKNQPLEAVIVRIYEQRSDHLVETDVTDIKGRFKFLVNPGVYYLTASKPEYISFRSSIMLLEKEKTMVSVNIRMQKQS